VSLQTPIKASVVATLSSEVLNLQLVLHDLILTMTFYSHIACLFLMSIACGSSMVDGLPSSLEGQDESHGVHWALIVAGSNGWYNYRHQVRSFSGKIVSPNFTEFTEATSASQALMA